MLAASLWIVLGWLALEQFKASKEFAQMLIEAQPEDKEKIELIKQAAAQVDNTTNSLFALLGLIATAVTGYFFVAAGTSSSLSSSSELPADIPQIITAKK